MSKHYPYIFLIIALILVNSFLLYSNYSLKRQQSQPLMATITTDKLTHILNERVITDSKLGLSFAFNKEVTLMGVSGKLQLLKDLYNTTERFLFFRFSPPNHCQSCVIDAITQIKTILGPESGTKAILLTTETEEKDLEIILQKYGLLSQIYVIDAAAFPEALEKEKSPFFFVMDKEFKISNVFLVQYELSHLTAKYLKTTKNQL